MAVGKGSMERAAKTAEKTQTAEAAAKTKKASAKKAAKPKTEAAAMIAAPTEEVLEKIVYQASDGMLERDAKPNERFGVGDAMPVYYF